MTQTPPEPGALGAAGSGDFDCWAAIGASDSTTRLNRQEKIASFLAGMEARHGSAIR
jgi:hypothetical protein